ncbi:MAG: hypothetical protein U0234_26620 [Sandaracinus sp.]
MYSAEHDSEHAVALWRIAGPLSADEWARHRRDMARIASWPATPRPAVILMVRDFAPTARQRAELADLSAHPGYRPYLVLVSSNALLRGALQAIRWLQRRTAYEMEIVADLETATAWLERRRGEPLPALRAMTRAASAPRVDVPA